jgi:hypothetical protein
MEIFKNLYCKTKLNREWFQEKNSILCVILEQFNEFLVRSIPPLGIKEFNFADLMLLGTTQRIFKFLLIQNYRENNISELTQWFSKNTQIKEFKQTFGVSKFCVGSIDDLYQFNGSSRGNSRKKRVHQMEEKTETQSGEPQGKSPPQQLLEAKTFLEDDTFDLMKFKTIIKNYFDPGNEKCYMDWQICKDYLENFNDTFEVFLIEGEQDEVPEEGLSGFNFIPKFKEHECNLFLYLYLYSENKKRMTIGRRQSETSDHDISESENERGYFESANQSEKSEHEDEDDEDKALLMGGLLITQKCEKVKEIREGIMMVIHQLEGVQARITIEKSFLKNKKNIKDSLII